MKITDIRLLLFDLDGTLLTSGKTVTERTLCALAGCRERGIMLGISTSRGERNAQAFTEKLQPDITISSGGAMVRYKDKYIFKAEFTAAETRNIINTVRSICGMNCEITADTADCHYWNYKTDPKSQDKSWGDSIYTDFSCFNQSTLKICVEIFDETLAQQLQEALNNCDCIRFSDGFWYKFTRKGVTKESAVPAICSVLGISPGQIAAFGDDLADIGMLKVCGRGIAVGNALSEVKAAADLVIGSNDEDGIAEYLEQCII